ncbi:histone-lysine N-methyltransferase SETMAR-like [Cataglyphis hispanica]|uniref:histone-lysine N-methyltransferase SETMAR-like n=1 Tax=Cataglyphis hispanica TaxID=1086592 RepID=UPI00218091C8|nr:histone-lysine N-methyltransferase SETMAR-like [Cataglyphis hispanica]
MNSTDIRVIFLYEYKLGNNAAKAARNINQAFGENTVNDRKVQRWFEKFRSGDFSLQNEPRGRPKTSVKNDALKALVETNPTVSSRELAARMEVDHTTILRHLSKIGKYENEDSLKNAISEFIDSKDQNFFKTGIYALKSRWEKCIEVNGAYFD